MKRFEQYEVATVADMLIFKQIGMKMVFENVWIYTFGVGALCATKVCHFSEEELSQMLTIEFQAMMMLIKSERSGGKNNG